jgi:hypothetical protein
MVVADRRVRRRREPREDRHQQHRDQRGRGRPHQPVHGLPAARQWRTAGGEQRDQQHADHPSRTAEQGRHGVDGEADLGVRVREVPEAVGQQPADVSESGHLDVVRQSAARQLVESERAAVNRDHVVTRPCEPAQHRHEEHHDRARARREFTG